MCSLIGSVGKNQTKAFLLNALRLLEHKGYDSVGSAFVSSRDLSLRCVKIVGPISDLEQILDEQNIDSTIGIAHLRWATHGTVSEENAHPQLDCFCRVAVVHNGVIENYHALFKQLKKNEHVFSSQTDTEVIAHLFGQTILNSADLRLAVQELVKDLDGAYAFLGLTQDYPDTLIAVRKRSPLSIGIAKDQIYVASDPVAFAEHTNKVIFMPDKSFALICSTEVELYDFEGKRLLLKPKKINLSWQIEGKGFHDHYMIKEIYEQKKAIDTTVNFYRSISNNIGKHIGISADEVKKIKTISLIGSGASFHAAQIGQFFFEEIAKIPTRAHLSSEFRYMSFFPDQNHLSFLISQSGETANTLEALRLINSFEMPAVAITNVASSSLVREASGFLLTQAGQELAVASTKGFTTQLVALYWLAHRIAYARKTITLQELERAQEDLQVAAEVLETAIENYRYDIAHHIAAQYAEFKQFIFLGRHINYPLALEGALKLKEVSYLFVQCYPAGELKYGPLVLIDDQTSVVFFSHLDPIIYQKLLSNAQEVKARGGHLLVFAFEGQYELEALADTAFIIPQVRSLLGPIAIAGLMQFFVYHIARVRGCPIDRPRHLAKSVTIE